MKINKIYKFKNEEESEYVFVLDDGKKIINPKKVNLFGIK